MIIFYILLEFFCGSLMFSYWLGLAVGKDLRKIGDGNPGAFNLWNAAGFKFGMSGVLLDFLKGYFPLVLLIESGHIKGYEIIPIAGAAILGHAFSPFMKLKGGKAVAVTFGVWSALTRFEISVAYAVILALFLLILKILKRGKSTSTEEDAFMNVIGMVIIAIYLLFRAFPDYLVILWLLNLLVMTFKNRNKLLSFYKNIKDTASL